MHQDRFKHELGHRPRTRGNHGVRSGEYAEGDVVVLDRAACVRRLTLTPGVYVVQSATVVPGPPVGFAYRLSPVDSDGAADFDTTAGPFLTFASERSPAPRRDDTECWQLLSAAGQDSLPGLELAAV